MSSTRISPCGSCSVISRRSDVQTVGNPPPLCLSENVAFQEDFDMDVIPWGDRTLDGNCNPTTCVCSSTASYLGGNFFNSEWCFGFELPGLYKTSTTRAQVAFSNATYNYYILELDMTTFVINQGCTGTSPACGIVELPVPPTSGDQLMYIFADNSGRQFSTLPNLANSLSDFAANFNNYVSLCYSGNVAASIFTLNPLFNPSQTCYASPANPFSGIFEDSFP